MKLLIRFKALVLFIFFVVFLYKLVVLLHQFHYSNQHIWLFEGLLISTLHKYIFLFVMHAFTRIIFHTWIQLCVIYHQLSTIQQLEVSWWAVYFVMKCVLFLFFFDYAGVVFVIFVLTLQYHYEMQCFCYCIHAVQAKMLIYLNGQEYWWEMDEIKRWLCLRTCRKRCLLLILINLHHNKTTSPPCVQTWEYSSAAHS